MKPSKKIYPILDCVICGSEYSYCPRCDADKHKPTWMFAYCSERCRNIEQILNKYQFGHINAGQAKVMLTKLDAYDDIAQFREDIAKAIKTIKDVEDAPKKVVAKKDKTVNDTKKDDK